MADREKLSKELLYLLKKIDFADRYYQFYETTRDRPKMKDFKDQLKDILSSTNPPFKYVRKEDFYVYREDHEACIFFLKASFRYSQIEWILEIELGEHYLGGPFTFLAEQAKQIDDPDFAYAPLAPRPHFSDLEELREAVDFGVSLFEDTKEAVLTEWGQK
jgi:hypothetical protein